MRLQVDLKDKWRNLHSRANGLAPKKQDVHRSKVARLCSVRRQTVHWSGAEIEALTNGYER